MQEGGPETKSKRQQCLREPYGDSYDWAWNISSLSISSIVIGAVTEYLEDEIRRQGNRILYGNSRQYEVGKRQIQTLSQFKKFNAAMAAAGQGKQGTFSEQTPTALPMISTEMQDKPMTLIRLLGAISTPTSAARSLR
jgi:hypothetical protein